MYLVIHTFKKQRGSTPNPGGSWASQIAWVGVGWCQVLPSPYGPSGSSRLPPHPLMSLSVQVNQMTTSPTLEVLSTIFSQIAQLASVVKPKLKRPLHILLQTGRKFCVLKATPDFLSWPRSRNSSSKPCPPPNMFFTLSPPAESLPCRRVSPGKGNSHGEESLFAGDPLFCYHY